MEKPNVVPHGLFYMENAGGYKPAQSGILPSMEEEEHQPSYFAAEEKKGAAWKGGGAMEPAMTCGPRL